MLGSICNLNGNQQSLRYGWRNQGISLIDPGPPLNE